MKRPTDPMAFLKTHWPGVLLYKEQEDIVYSVQDNIETYVPAGNELGKDFVAAFIALWFFCSRRPARVVTTSVNGDQLRDVLWGEINWFIRNSKNKLPIQYNHLQIRQVYNDGSFVPKCELVGQVVQKGEGLLGRHVDDKESDLDLELKLKLDPMPSENRGEDPFGVIPRTLVIFDEASAIDDITYTSCLTWSHRRLMIGNCWETSNFFRRGVEDGDKILTT